MGAFCAPFAGALSTYCDDRATSAWQSEDAVSSNRWVTSLFVSWCCVQSAYVEACSVDTGSDSASSLGGRGATQGKAEAAETGAKDSPSMSTASRASGGQGGSSSASKPTTPRSTGQPQGGGSSASAGSNAAAGSTGSAAMSGDAGSAVASDRFSFFVTSYAAMQRLSGTPDGFGGDLRYGQADGLKGADKICTEIAESSMAGSGKKVWRAFLSVTKGTDGKPVHAADRVGQGPWYDRLGRLVAQTREDLLNSRPKGADAAIANDLPNEDGVPNHAPDGSEALDNHDVLTGSNETGQLFSSDWSSTCHDWTSAQGVDGKPRVGHSWPRSAGDRGGSPSDGSGDPGQGRRPRAPAAGSGAPNQPGQPTQPGQAGTAGRQGNMDRGDMANWMSALDEAGCAPGASLVEMGPPDPDNPTVGSGGGYGAIYCFALQP
jgi:hypothetical protein